MIHHWPFSGTTVPKSLILCPSGQWKVLASPRDPTTRVQGGHAGAPGSEPTCTPHTAQALITKYSQPAEEFCPGHKTLTSCNRSQSPGSVEHSRTKIRLYLCKECRINDLLSLDGRFSYLKNLSLLRDGVGPTVLSFTYKG